MAAPDFMPQGIGTPDDEEKRRCEANQKKLRLDLGLKPDAPDEEVTAKLKEINDKSLRRQLGLAESSTDKELKDKLRSEQRATILRMLRLLPGQEEEIGKALKDAYIRELEKVKSPEESESRMKRLVLGECAYEKSKVEDAAIKVRTLLGMQTTEEDLRKIWDDINKVC